MFAVNITTGCRYGGSCLMVAMTTGLGVYPLSKSGYLEVATVSLHLYWRLSLALAAAWEAAMKPIGSVAQGLSGEGSLASCFHLSPDVDLSLALEGPAAACCG